MYGKESPSHDELPIKARANTLMTTKKKVSSFMPQKTVPWDEICQEGNPTRSTAVDSLIRRVQKFEVRQVGVESKARRAIEYAEFINVLTIIRNDEEYKPIPRFKLGAVLTLH